MKSTLATLCLTAVVTALQAQSAVADQGSTVDVVYFWTSKSEEAALDVYRQAWRQDGNHWIDLPSVNEAALQRTVSERIAHGYPPAVMQWVVDTSARELPDFGVVQSIDTIAQEDGWHDRLPAFILERISHQDEIYFVPSNLHTENWIWTSKHIFNELNLSVPQTWDDIFAAADLIKQAGYTPISLGDGSWEISLIFHNILYAVMGAAAFEKILNGDADAVLDPAMLDTLNLLRRISHYVEPKPSRTGKSWADATAMIGSGQAGMQFMGDWAKGELISLGYQAGKGFDCAITPGTMMPYFMVVDAFAFPLTAREEDLQAQLSFARMVFDPQNQVEFSRIKGSLPVRTDVDPRGLDHCAQLGLQQLQQEKQMTDVHTRSMPSHLMAAWTNILAEFFNDTTMLSTDAQQQLHEAIKQS
ncbi:ABC transporter substrate-binding protein [Nitrincola sp. MINF-07-Sa-05]|uniref:ABC transporter substrate-binding protein n=1 Tax=Nitrincola salilacus TaxID=3400273 RepID=UPI00391839A7